MSKPIIRVFVSVLITLILVAGVYTSVFGASLNGGAKSAQVQAGAGLGFHRTSLGSFGAQPDAYDELEQDCHHDSMINPEDY